MVAAADYLAERDLALADRTAIYGRSKGCMIAVLAIERFPKRFKAAVDVVGIADMVAYMACKPGFRGADVARQPMFRGKSIAQDAGPYIEVSPLNHVKDIQTPLLVEATTGDKTAPVQLHAGRLIELLRAHGKTFESKIYEQAPGGHVFSMADSAQARESEDRVFDFLRRHMNWPLEPRLKLVSPVWTNQFSCLSGIKAGMRDRTRPLHVLVLAGQKDSSSRALRPRACRERSRAPCVSSTPRSSSPARPGTSSR